MKSESEPQKPLPIISEKGEWLKCDACGHVAFYEIGGLCSGCLARDTSNMDWPTDAEVALAKAVAVIQSIVDRYVDGDNTYDDWRFMGETASAYFKASEPHSPDQ
jgi:hypothetical protein